MKTNKLLSIFAVLLMALTAQGQETPYAGNVAVWNWSNIPYDFLQPYGAEFYSTDVSEGVCLILYPNGSVSPGISRGGGISKEVNPNVRISVHAGSSGNPGALLSFLSCSTDEQGDTIDLVKVEIKANEIDGTIDDTEWTWDSNSNTLTWSGRASKTPPITTKVSVEQDWLFIKGITTITFTFAHDHMYGTTGSSRYTCKCGYLDKEKMITFCDVNGDGVLDSSDITDLVDAIMKQ